jgi:ferritin-like protein
MAPNRITRGGAVRRAPLLALAALLAAVALAACGEGGDVTTAVPDKDGDAETLNRILTRQLAAIDAYDRSIPALNGAERAMAIEFRAQEQEHADAIVKALRGIGGVAEPDEEEEIEANGLRSEADHLVFLYEVESATIDDELNAISNLTAPWIRPLMATIVANQAQHLVLLRRALGAKPLETVPAPFEDGTVAAP